MLSHLLNSFFLSVFSFSFLLFFNLSFNPFSRLLFEFYYQTRKLSQSSGLLSHFHLTLSHPFSPPSSSLISITHPIHRTTNQSIRPSFHEGETARSMPRGADPGLASCHIPMPPLFSPHASIMGSMHLHSTGEKINLWPPSYVWYLSGWRMEAECGRHRRRGSEWGKVKERKGSEKKCWNYSEG